MLNVGGDDVVRKPYRLNEICACLTRQLGLQFSYTDTQPTESVDSRPLSTMRLSALPQELRNELIYALGSLERDYIDAMIGQVLP